MRQPWSHLDSSGPPVLFPFPSIHGSHVACDPALVPRGFICPSLTSGHISAPASWWELVPTCLGQSQTGAEF